MTREEAIKDIQENIKPLVGGKSLDMAIEALKADPKDIFYDGYVHCLIDFDIDTVLCKDCKHHEDEEPGMVYCPNIVGGWVSNIFYCGYGERKAEVENET